MASTRHRRRRFSEWDCRSRTTYDTVLQPGTEQKRLAVVNSTVERYDLRVSNGSALWLYDQRRAKATRISLSSPGSDRGKRLQRLFASLNMATAADAATDSQSVEPLPVVPRGEQRPTESARSMTVSYRGTESLDGREVYVIHVAPKDDTATYEQTIWVDTEQFFPVKKRTAWTADGEPIVHDVLGVTFDTGVPHTCLPPASRTYDVEVPETPERQTYESVGASMPTPRSRSGARHSAGIRTDLCDPDTGTGPQRRPPLHEPDQSDHCCQVRPAGCRGQRQRRGNNRRTASTGQLRADNISVEDCERYRYRIRVKAYPLKCLKSVSQSAVPAASEQPRWHIEPPYSGSEVRLHVI